MLRPSSIDVGQFFLSKFTHLSYPLLKCRTFHSANTRFYVFGLLLIAATILNIT